MPISCQTVGPALTRSRFLFLGQPFAVCLPDVSPEKLANLKPIKVCPAECLPNAGCACVWARPGHASAPCDLRCCVRLPQRSRSRLWTRSIQGFLHERGGMRLCRHSFCHWIAVSTLGTRHQQTDAGSVVFSGNAGLAWQQRSRGARARAVRAEACARGARSRLRPSPLSLFGSVSRVISEKTKMKFIGTVSEIW